MRAFTILAFFALSLAACSSTTPAPAPYVAAPIADLAADTPLDVRGNHTGWWRNNKVPVGENVVNDNGPKLQRLVTTATAGQYVAVFRNNVTNVSYGRSVFTMPASGGVFTGTTDLGHKFTITNNNNALTYTLTGLFSIATKPGATAGRYAYGGFAAGSSTPTGDLPTTGSATYTGSFIGQSSVAGLVTGDASITVDFTAATDQVSGSITNISGGGYTISDLGISAIIQGLDSSYSGIVTSGPTTGSAADFPTGTTGPIDGGLYGPNGEETGGTLRIKNVDNFLTGSFGGS